MSALIEKVGESEEDAKRPLFAVVIRRGEKTKHVCGYMDDAALNMSADEFVARFLKPSFEAIKREIG